MVDVTKFIIKTKQPKIEKYLITISTNLDIILYLYLK